MKKIMLLMFFVSLILVSSMVTAQDIITSVERLTDQVPAGGESLFKLTVKNAQSRQDTFRVTPDDLAVYPFSDFASSIKITPTQIIIEARESKILDVAIRVLDSAVPNKNYVSKIKIRSMMYPEVKEDIELTTFVISSEEVVKIELTVPQEIIPGKNTPFQINFENKGNVVLEDADVYLTSEVFSDTRTLSFLPYQTLTEDFVFNISSITKPGTYDLSIRVYKDQNLKGTDSTQFTILANPDIKEKTTTEKGFLGLTKKTTFVKTNEGNSPVDETIEIPVSFFGKMFTSADPQPTVVKREGVNYLTWQFTVEPNESFTVEVVKDFKPLFISILVVVLFIVIILYWLSKGITIKKRVFRIRDEKEGISELKILLHVNNRGHEEVKNVKVLDILPHLIKPMHEFGTLKPDRIQKGTKGSMRLIWSIPTLEPGEERVISYKVRSKLHIVGRMILPPAMVQYAGRKGDIVSVKSNKLILVAKKE